MKILFWEILARLGFWIPIAKYKPNRKYDDWVIVALREKSTGIFFVPKVAEYSPEKDSWHFDNDDITHWPGRFYESECDFIYWHKLPRNPEKLCLERTKDK